MSCRCLVVPLALITRHISILFFIGREIIDEGDKDIDMQKLAKKLWKTKAQKLGVDEDVIKPDADDNKA